MAPHLVAGFMLAVLPLIATPGASLTLLTRYAATDGPRAARPVVLGTVCGLYVPQFVEPDRPLWSQVLILATAQSALVAVWLGGWSLAIGRIRGYARVLRRVSAVTLVFLGLRAATA